MKFEDKQIGTVDICTPAGPIMDEDSVQFAAHLKSKLKGQSSRLVISMGDVQYVDSVALEAMLDVADYLSSRGSRLKLVQVQPLCREILQVTGISQRFTYFQDMQSAVRSYL